MSVGPRRGGIYSDPSVEKERARYETEYTTVAGSREYVIATDSQRRQGQQAGTNNGRMAEPEPDGAAVESMIDPCSRLAVFRSFPSYLVIILLAGIRRHGASIGCADAGAVAGQELGRVLGAVPPAASRRPGHHQRLLPRGQHLSFVLQVLLPASRERVKVPTALVSNRTGQKKAVGTCMG
jgi:hypothetical protein